MLRSTLFSVPIVRILFFFVMAVRLPGRGRALQQFEAFHEGELIKLHQFEVMQVANLMQADSEVEEVRPGFRY